MAVEPPPARTLLIGGNWKCNLTRAEAIDLATGLAAIDVSNVDVVVAPISLQLEVVSSTLSSASGDEKSDGGIMVSAQNVSATGTGAYTGEIAPSQLLDAGINWTIIGHSERRAYYNETDDVVTTKIKNALAAGLNIIACLGETADERKAGDTENVIVRQLEAIKAGVSDDQWKQVVIAYEPVWAIGKNPDGSSRKPCDADEAQNVCLNYVRANLPEAVKSSVRILYGGSVKPGNAAGLIVNPDIDGFLVGGASLKAENFGPIIKAAQDSIAST